MANDLWMQVLRDRDKCKMRADRNAQFLRTLYLLYNAEIKSVAPVGCSLCPEELKGAAIYGGEKVGTALASFLRRRGCEVLYFVDAKGAAYDASVPCYTPWAGLPPTQLMIITDDYGYDDIAAEMRVAVKCPVVAMSDFLQEQLDRKETISDK